MRISPLIKNIVKKVNLILIKMQIIEDIEMDYC